MKLKLLSIAVCAAVTLAGCKSTPEEDMSLPVGFEQQAQLIPLKRPALTLTDEAWHQAIGPFQLTNMDLSGKSTERVTTSTGWQTTARGGLLFQLMFHDDVNLSGDWVNRFNTRAEQTFSFDIQAQAQAPVHVKCQMLVFGKSEETVDNGVNSYNWQATEQTASYLGCKLTQQGQVSELVVEDKTGTPPTVRLYQGSNPVAVELVHGAPEMAQFNALFHAGAAGYLLAAGGQTQAALQLSRNQSRLWLKQDLPAAQQQWLLAALFSLQMYDWQNQQWPVERLNP